MDTRQSEGARVDSPSSVSTSQSCRTREQPVNNSKPNNNRMADITVFANDWTPPLPGSSLVSLPSLSRKHWSDAELHRMALIELNAPSSALRSINDYIHSSGAPLNIRGMEAIKSIRRRAKYTSLISALRKGSPANRINALETPAQPSSRNPHSTCVLGSTCQPPSSAVAQNPVVLPSSQHTETTHTHPSFNAAISLPYVRLERISPYSAPCPSSVSVPISRISSSFSCPLCSRHFPSNQSLAQHKHHAHSLSKVPSSFTCEPSSLP